MKLIASLRLLLLLTVGLAASSANAALEIDVDGGDVGAKPIAIVPFATPPDVSFDVAAVVEADLVRSGYFKALPRADMLERPNDPAKMDFKNWRTVGMEAVTIGSITRNGNGIAVRFFLMDPLRGAQLLGFDMPPVGADQMRVVSHQIADLIYEKLTGIKGYFNTQIAYVTASGYGPGRRFELVVADADGYNPRSIATSREPLMSPAWSPDGTKLAYVGYERGRSAIYIHTLATGQLKKVISEKGINGSPAWSPGGNKLLVTLSFETNPDLYLVDLDSGSRTRLTDHYGIDTEGAISPDGTQVAFTSDRGGSPQIYLMSINGGEPRRITFQGRQNLRARFAPDGKSLVVVNAEGGRYTVATVSLADGSTKTLSDGPLDESPSFAPNGSVIIYATASRGNPELATVTTDGRVRQRLRQPGEVREPAWGPNHR